MFLFSIWTGIGIDVVDDNHLGRPFALANPADHVAGSKTAAPRIPAHSFDGAMGEHRTPLQNNVEFTGQPCTVNDYSIELRALQLLRKIADCDPNTLPTTGKTDGANVAAGALQADFLLAIRCDDQLVLSPLYSRTWNVRLIVATVLLLIDIRSAMFAIVISVDARS